MRLKTFVAANTNEALAQVREEMGGEAIVVSTHQDANGQSSQVVAALEDAPSSDLEAEESQVHELVRDEADVAQTIRQVLRYHGVPDPLTERLVRSACALDAENATLAFAGAIDTSFRFSPLSEQTIARPLMLVGPPGSGKTITVAKLAARGVLGGNKVGVITTDISRAGAKEQLSAFTRILKLDLQCVATARELREVTETLADCDQIYIDTAGANPYSEKDMQLLEDMITAVDAEPVLVLAAGCDALEAAETAAAFSQECVERLIVTRLDLSRRLGAVLTAADAGNLSFSDVSVTPQVADGLSPINPVSLARIIMPYAKPETES